MVESLAAQSCGFDKDSKVLNYLLLTIERFEAPRTERFLKIGLRSGDSLATYVKFFFQVLIYLLSYCK